MVRRHWYFVVAAGVLAAGAAGVMAQQQRGGSGLPPGPGNPLASLQAQIDSLTHQVAQLGGGIQGGAESGLVMIRGTIGGAPPPVVLQGAGFTVTATVNLPCGSNLYPEYLVTFDEPFSAPPSVVVSARDVVFTPLGDGGNRPVYTAAIDNGPGGGGVTPNGFSVRIKTDGFSSTCFGSQNWDFIAIGPR